MQVGSIYCSSRAETTRGRYQIRERKRFASVSITGKYICGFGFQPKEEALIHRVIKVLFSPWQLVGSPLTFLDLKSTDQGRRGEILVGLRSRCFST